MGQVLRTRLVFLIPIFLLAAAVAGGLLWWRFFAPPVPGPLRLVPVDYSALPGWKTSDPDAALAAFRRSCAVLAKKPADTPMGGAGYAGTADDWRGACDAADTAEDAKGFFERWFRPVAVSAGAVKEGLFTGYYEPQIEVSRTQHGAYRTPVYGVPDDLVTVDLGKFRDDWAHDHIAGRVEGHTLVPYPDRAKIDADGLTTAPILFYAKNPIAVFFLHIQGSGRAVFDDGTVARIAYAAQNGQPYKAIGATLRDEGAIPPDQISLQTIRAWLKAHPGEAQRVMETNRSYVFFKVTPLGDPKLGSPGSEGVALTPGASLAVDPRLHALGVPVFLAATAPDADPAKPDRPFDRLLIAQDTGGAIRGPVRGDVFWGFGAAAQRIAGRMKAHGEMFVLLPKDVAARLGDGKDFP